MRKRSLFTAILGALGLFAFTNNPLRAEADFVMNFGTVAPDGTPWSEQLKSLKKLIETASTGRIKIKLFLGGALGSEIEMIQDVMRGERLQAGGFSTGAMGEALAVPVLEMVELPYLFRNNMEADAILDDILYDITEKALAEKGIQFYAWTENGWRNFATVGGAATSPEELKAFKMRSQESSVHMNMYKAMGVQAVSKPTSEVIPSLNTGIVNGFDNTPLFSLAAGWIEPVTHYTLSRHIYQPAAVVYAKSFVDKLPADLKNMLLADPKGESQRGRTSVRQLEGELLETIGAMGKQVIALSPAQQKAFRQAVRKPTHAAFLQENPEMQPVYEEIKTKLKAMRGN